MCLLYSNIDSCEYNIRGIEKVAFLPYNETYVVRTVGDYFEVKTPIPFTEYYHYESSGSFTESLVQTANSSYYELNLTLYFNQLTEVNSKALKKLVEVPVIAYVETRDGRKWVLGVDGGLRVNKYEGKTGSFKDGYSGYEMNWVGRGVGGLKPLAEEPIQTPRVIKQFTYHFRGNSKTESVFISDLNITNLKVYDVLNQSEDPSNLSYEYVPNVDIGTPNNCGPIIDTGGEVDLPTLRSLIAQNNVAFSLTLKLNDYAGNTKEDSVILIEYETDGNNVDPENFTFTMPVISSDTIVGFVDKINVSAFNFTNVFVGIRTSYSDNFTLFPITTLASLNATINSIPTGTYYGIHIWTLNPSVSFTFNYV